MYAIKDWNAVFENNKSRTMDVPSYVNWPVRRNSEAFAVLMQDSGGMIAFGLFGALVQWVGARPRAARMTGILADEKGALTPERMAVRMGAPRRIVRAAWERLVSVGWLVAVNETDAARPSSDGEVSAKCPPSDRDVTPKCYGTERNGTGEDRNGLKRDGTESDDADEPTPPPEQRPRAGESNSHPLPSVRPSVPSRTELNGSMSVAEALAALRIDGEAARALAVAEGLDVPTLRGIVAQIDAQPGVRNPKRLLVSVLCQRFGVTLTKAKKHSIGCDVRNIVAEVERIRSAKIGGVK